MEQLSRIVLHPRYGMIRCKKGSKMSEIYISTYAIQSAPLSMYDLLKINASNNLLVNVILDELVHAKTHADHGTP